MGCDRHGRDELAQLFSLQQLRGEPVGVEAAEPIYSSLLTSVYRRHPRAARPNNPK